MARILVIEDDPAIRMGLEAGLSADGHEVKTAGDGEKGLQAARREGIDLILLDLMLPRKSGEDICRELRAAGVRTPIIMLTSKKEEIDKVVGLELGADDYVTKPFGMRELQARVRAVLRRGAPAAAAVECVAFGDVTIDFRRQEATRGGQPVKLSSREFAVLKYLAAREREVVSRNQLLDEVWGYDAFPTTRTVDNYILSLRKKLEADPANPAHLLTVHTNGYKFVRG
ncbi:MAG: response regulator transcription factor [Acidobacteria bacterium]|nr:response regulator transcription factor [Acidobacteriota bacterium]